MKIKSPILVLVPLCLSACMTPAWMDDGGVPSFYAANGAGLAAPLEPRNPEPAPRNAQGPIGSALDLGVVEPSSPGVTEVRPATHGVEPTESGRLYILELYQQVLDQRDALELEVTSLLTELEGSRTRIADIEDSHAKLSVRVDDLVRETADLRGENGDLAARLTTAQIRRLEAEKLLLESKIDWQRALLDALDPAADLGDEDAGVALREEQ